MFPKLNTLFSITMCSICRKSLVGKLGGKLFLLSEEVLDGCDACECFNVGIH